MNRATQNRLNRRDKKRAGRRHGQRGGTGKRTHLIQDIWTKRAKKIEERYQQQPTGK